MGIGERLKQEREAKNLSLQDIQKQTKIQTRYLHAIEEERFEIMPGSFYVRAFIKEYATALQLNAEDLMSEYERDLPFDKEEKVALSRVSSSKKNKPISKTPSFFSFLPTIIVIVLIIGILVIYWALQNNDKPDDSNANDNTIESGEGSADEVTIPPVNSEQPSNDEENQESASDDTQDTSDEDTTNESNTTIQLEQYANNESTYQLSTSEAEVILTIETTDQNWMQVEDVNGEQFMYKTFTNEESPAEINISSTEELFIRFGNPSTVTFFINGEKIELSEEIGNTTTPQNMYINIEKQ